MDPNNQWQRNNNNSSHISGRDGYEFLTPDPALTVLPPKKNKKIVIIAGIIVLMVAAIAALMLIFANNQKVKYVTESPDAISFVYPSEWQKVSAEETGYTTAYLESTNLSSTPMALYYKKDILPGEKTAPNDLTEEYIQQVLDVLTVNMQSSYMVDGVECEEFNIDSSEAKKINGGIKFTILFSCSKNVNDVAVRAVNTYLYTGDGNLYEVSVIAQTQDWKTNQETLTTLLDGIRIGNE